MVKPENSFPFHTLQLCIFLNATKSYQVHPVKTFPSQGNGFLSQLYLLAANTVEMCLIRSTTRLLTRPDERKLERKLKMENSLKHKVFTQLGTIPVPPLIVVPGNQLHEVRGKGNSCLCIKNARPEIAWKSVTCPRFSDPIT